MSYVNINCFGELSDIFQYAFDLSLQTEIFSDPLEVAKGTLVIKIGDLTEINNHRPMSLLPFLENIQRIMYNHLYNHLVDKKYYIPSSSASESRSTEHAIIHLVNQIYESFENDNYILEFFIY